jgi:NADPH-dependent 2,4-dienoyl-CoA reductase/sulfur reductase-like enzyme
MGSINNPPPENSADLSNEAHAPNGNTSNGNGTGSMSKPVGSYRPSGIDVLVVGTGLAGLTASIECVRKGHRVKVLERNATINTAGNI